MYTVIVKNNLIFHYYTQTEIKSMVTFRSCDRVLTYTAEVTRLTSPTKTDAVTSDIVESWKKNINVNLHNNYYCSFPIGAVVTLRVPK